MEKLKADRIVFYSIICGIAAVVTLAMVILWFIKRMPPLMPLLYSIPWGEEQLVPWWVIPILPIAAFFWLVLNSLIVLWLLPRENLLARVVMAGAALAILLLATTGVKIVLLTHL